MTPPSAIPRVVIVFTDAGDCQGVIALASSSGRVFVGDRLGDVCLYVARAAVSEVDFNGFCVEGRDGGDEPAAVGADDLGGRAVAQLVDADAVARRRSMRSAGDRSGVGGL